MITRQISITIFLGSLLASCGTTANEDYCKISEDCLGNNQICVDNLCEESVLDGGMEDGGVMTIDAGPPPEVAAVPTWSAQAIKTFSFTWTDVSDATHYKLLANADGASEFVQVGEDIAAGDQSVDLIVPLYARASAKYILQSCNTGGCIDSDPVEVTGNLQEAIGYVKSDTTNEVGGESFGYSVALSADGTTLAVGVSFDTQIYSEERVFVFQRTGSTWSEQAVLVASNNEENDHFGSAIALSSDGNTIAVGAYGESSSARGIGGIQDNNALVRAGAVYVFSRSGSSWSQQAYVKASTTDAEDRFGESVGMGSDGNTMVVGAPGEDSNATGVGGSQGSDFAESAGAVYVFRRSGTIWAQQAFLKASNTDSNDNFGTSVGLSDAGDALAVGAPGEDSNAMGIGGNESNDSAIDAGAAYTFRWDGAAWGQEEYIKASNANGDGGFGGTIALSADGSTLAAGGTGFGAGSAWVYVRTNMVWTPEAYFPPSGTFSQDRFGYSLSLSADGGTLAIGAVEEGSNSLAINGDEANDSALGAGAVFTFTRDGGWNQQSYLKASNTNQFDEFGKSVAISGDGSTLAVGAPSEDSNATTIGGDQNDNSAPNAGAVYLY